MREVFVVKGPNDPGAAAGIAYRLGARLVGVYTKKFPDGEAYIRIGEQDLEGATVVIVNTLYPRQDESWIETLLLADAVRELGAGLVVAVIPYLAYSRQDKVFLKGEPISVRALLKALRSAGVDCLVTIDVHNPSSLREFRGCALNILVSDLLVKKAAEELDNPIVLAPDRGALERARVAAEAIGARYDYLVKRRDRVTGEVSVEPKELDVSGKDVIIVDDIISTGGTIALATRESLKQGARSVTIAATHALLVGNAIDKIKRSGARKLVTANTVNKPIEGVCAEVVDASTRIVEAIEELL